MKPSVVCFVTASSVPLLTAHTAAQPASTAEGPPRARNEALNNPPPELTSSRDLGWRENEWPHARPWEYVVAPALIATGITFRFGLSEPNRDASAGNSFDLEIQRAIQPESKTYADVMKSVSDVGFIGPIVYRGLEDIFAVGVARGSWQVAADLLVMDAAAYGLIGTVVWSSQLAFGRRRPRNHFCETSTSYREEFPDCSTEGINRSFFSGHFAVAVAGASLTCTHHERLDIYPSDAGGTIACATTAVSAAVEGIARSTAGWHWPTDMLLGGALGFTAGWILPRVLHYGFGDDRTRDFSGPEDGPALPMAAAIVPVPRHDGGTLQLVGVF